MKTFAQQLQAHRHKLKLSQAQYAKKYSLCAATLRSWEQGRRMPYGLTALKLVKIMAQPPKITAIEPK